MFAPRREEFLDVAVLTVGKRNATALGKEGRGVGPSFIQSFNTAISSALGTFKVHIQDIPADSPLEVGQALTIKIVSVAYREGLPEIIGVCNDSLTGHFNQQVTNYFLFCKFKCLKFKRGLKYCFILSREGGSFFMKIYKFAF